ncbi:histone H1-II-like [Acyrthosiphon pisum]|uniref:Transposable element P transposase-like GTP-binding insertion domain-containing protein n=1 Tax=Acyrthosiphon pisum TaxID=7029 RepID=A0A8R2B8A2_ACYPI|nr:histone H1-II-like [Acyrthosiphon pisum]|eukprot:XP_008186041.1 PREDICTED: histone H1-II-like [Acyrthosiphon pisum]
MKNSANAIDVTSVELFNRVVEAHLPPNMCMVIKQYVEMGWNRLATKLSETHINPGPFQKMKVKYAAQVFNNTVAAAMQSCVQGGSLPLIAETTITFTKHIVKAAGTPKKKKLVAAKKPAAGEPAAKKAKKAAATKPKATTPKKAAAKAKKPAAVKPKSKKTPIKKTAAPKKK